MIKLVLSTSFDFDTPTASLIDTYSRGLDYGALQKRASAFTIKLARDVKPDPNHSYIHLISLGAMEFYGFNRNFDGMNEKRAEFEFPNPIAGTPKRRMLGGGLMEYHSTFKKHGHVFKHHQNHSPSLSIGDIFAEAYNTEAHRGELIVKVANEHPDWKDDLKKLASGKDIPFSMACVTDPEYPVLTREGYKKISEVVVDDLVWTHKGRWRRVKAVNRRVYSGKLCKFSVNGLPFPVELTADHLMWAKCFVGSRSVGSMKAKAGRFFSDSKAFEKQPASWAHAEHIDVGDRFFYQPVTKFDGFGAIDSTELATIMGYYLAEGSFGYNGEKACTTQFSCHMDDELPRLLPKIMAKLFPAVNVTIRPGSSGAVCLSVDVHHTGFSEFLKLFCGRYSDKKYICQEIFNSSKEVKLAFLGAWNSGDGFVDVKGLHWSTCSKSLALQGRDLLASIGIPSSIYAIDHAKCATSGHEGSGFEYTLNVSHLEALPIADWSAKALKCLTYLSEQKRTKPAALRPCKDGRFAYRIKNIEYREVVDCQTFNFEVEEDESYSLGGFISHNCKVPNDICSICGKKSRTRAEYCSHLSDHPTEITKEGHFVGAINDETDYFDISKVTRPADRIAWSLYKAAEFSPLSSQGRPISGAALAEQLGVVFPRFAFFEGATSTKREKLAAAQKLADIEKRVSAMAKGEDNTHLKSIARAIPEDLSDKDVDSLRSCQLCETLQALNDAQICLSVRDFMRLVLKGEHKAAIPDLLPSVKSRLPGIFTRMLDSGDVDEAAGDNSYDSNSSTVPHHIKELVSRLVQDHSTGHSPVLRRMQITIIRGTKKPELKGQEEKNASATVQAEGIAREYAKYQLSFVKNCSEDLTYGGALTVLRNFANV